MEGELKSAYQLAIERLRARERGESVPLPEAARRRISGIRSEFQARRAEVSILAEARKADAAAAGDDVRLEQIESDRRREMARLLAEEESLVEAERAKPVATPPGG